MNKPTDAHRQLAYSLRMDWGVTGAETIAATCDVAVVIDVLSFTTTLSVAADRGVVVFPTRGAMIGLGASRRTRTRLWPSAVRRPPSIR